MLTRKNVSCIKLAGNNYNKLLFIRIFTVIVKNLSYYFVYLYDADVQQ